jgi:hypothetical protein
MRRLRLIALILRRQARNTDPFLGDIGGGKLIDGMDGVIVWLLCRGYPNPYAFFILLSFGSGGGNRENKGRDSFMVDGCKQAWC